MVKKIALGLFIMQCFSFCEKPEYDRLSLSEDDTPFDKYLPAPSDDGVLITHSYYSLSYSEAHEQAEWAYYVLKKEYPTSAVSRQNDFREDPDITSGSAQLDDYKYSGFDRGHLVPSGDMTFSLTANSETFLLSNICPQRKELNQNKWRELEEYLRTAVSEYGNLYIVTGPIFGSSTEHIGANEVTVAEAFYKAIYYSNETTGSHMIGFIMENGSNSNALSNYVVSIDEIEHQTGLDLFSQLDNKLEKTLEKEIRLEGWGDLDE